MNAPGCGIPGCGTRAGYQEGCRCPAARDANAAWHRKRRRMIAYGRWNCWADAGPVRSHVRTLQDAGMGIKQIASVAGVSAGAITALLYGASAGRQPSQRMRPHIAKAILAVHASHAALADGALTDATGTRRRLQALAATGWYVTAVARELGIQPVNLRGLLTAGQVTAATSRRVVAVYNQLWDKPPPTGTHQARKAVTQTRAAAAAAGWPPPMAWDDDQIDNPAARPKGCRPADSDATGSPAATSRRAA